MSGQSRVNDDRVVALLESYRSEQGAAPESTHGDRHAARKEGRRFGQEGSQPGQEGCGSGKEDALGEACAASHFHDEADLSRVG